MLRLLQSPRLIHLEPAFLRIVKIICFLILIVIFPLITAVSVYAAQVTLVWNENTEEDLAGYNVYYGFASRDYQNVIDVGNVTNYTVSNLTECVLYFFTVTAYDTSDTESGYSNEVNVIITPSGLFFPTILDKDGTLWITGTGWERDTPPYYSNSNYAVNLEYRDDKNYLILHRDGAVWLSDTGWVLNTPPYYPNSGYARDVKFKEDNSYTVLHRDGALWNSVSGWILTFPHYYPGSDYAKDLEYRADGIGQ